MYRCTQRYQERRRLRQRAMQEGKARARMAREPVERWEPPDLRRRLIVEDYDAGNTMRTVIDMHRTSRIDCYRVTVNGIPQDGRPGWSRVLDMLRRAMPRKCSPRWIGE